MCIHLIPLEIGSQGFDKEQRWNLCFVSSPTHGEETLGVKKKKIFIDVLRGMNVCICIYIEVGKLKRGKCPFHQVKFITSQGQALV